MKAVFGRLKAWLWPSVSEPVLDGLIAHASRRGICRRFAESLTFRQPENAIDARVFKAVSHFAHYRWRSSAALTGMLANARLEGTDRDRAVAALLTALGRIPAVAIHWPIMGVQYVLLSLPLTLPLGILSTREKLLGEHISFPLGWSHGLLAVGWTLGTILLTCIALIPFAGALYLSMVTARVNFVAAAAAHALGEVEDPRAFAGVAHATQDMRPQVRNQAIQALRKLLPAVLASDLQDLDLNTTAALCRLLSEGDEAAIRTSLAFLERAGEARAIPAVAKLAAFNRYGTGLEAAHVLSVLENRSAENRMRAQMLRPSARDAGDAELLRAASVGAPQKAEQLLRAHE